VPWALLQVEVKPFIKRNDESTLAAYYFNKKQIVTSLLKDK